MFLFEILIKFNIILHCRKKPHPPINNLAAKTLRNTAAAAAKRQIMPLKPTVPLKATASHPPTTIRTRTQSVERKKPLVPTNIKVTNLKCSQSTAKVETKPLVSKNLPTSTMQKSSIASQATTLVKKQPTSTSKTNEVKASTKTVPISRNPSITKYPPKPNDVP